MLFNRPAPSVRLSWLDRFRQDLLPALSNRQEERAEGKKPGRRNAARRHASRSTSKPRQRSLGPLLCCRMQLQPASSHEQAQRHAWLFGVRTCCKCTPLCSSTSHVHMIPATLTYFAPVLFTSFFFFFFSVGNLFKHNRSDGGGGERQLRPHTFLHCDGAFLHHPNQQDSTRSGRVHSVGS